VTAPARRSPLRWAPAVTVAAFLLPLAAGLIGTVLPAFGYLPAVGGESLSLWPWRRLLAEPGLATALRLTIVTGLSATLISVALVASFCAFWHGRPLFRAVQRCLPAILAAPHAALAIGLAFLVAPSGWIVRLVSPELTGWDRPPDLPLPNDPWGATLILGLVMKEAPYLLLMALASLNQIRPTESLTLARSLGYPAWRAWMAVIWPQLYPQLRLPVYAVLGYSLSTVDVALILGPNTPPPLSVLMLRWFQDRDLTFVFPAAAGAVAILLIVLGAILLWRAGEWLIARMTRPWLTAGPLPTGPAVGRWLSGAAAVTIGLGAAGALAGMALWSVAQSWRFPYALPVGLTLEGWARHAGSIADPAAITAVVALAAVGIALALSLACLENEAARGRAAGSGGLRLLYLPLLVPQIAFMFGVQVVFVRLGIDGSLGAVIWAHLLFVLPYLFLSLADQWRRFDRRYLAVALSLGAGPGRAFWQVKLPMMLRPVLAATALGFAVSISLYLPTVFAGAGRWPTLTTEAVTLAGGADRRLIGIYAFLVFATPMLLFALAIGLPAWIHRHRAGLRTA